MFALNYFTFGMCARCCHDAQIIVMRRFVPLGIHFPFRLSRAFANVGDKLHWSDSSFLQTFQQRLPQQFGGGSKAVFAALGQVLLVKQKAEGAFAHALGSHKISRIACSN